VERKSFGVGLFALWRPSSQPTGSSRFDDARLSPFRIASRFASRRARRSVMFGAAARVRDDHLSGP
jgi:hypothetical protein